MSTEEELSLIKKIMVNTENRKKVEFEQAKNDFFSFANNQKKITISDKSILQQFQKRLASMEKVSEEMERFNEVKTLIETIDRHDMMLRMAIDRNEPNDRKIEVIGNQLNYKINYLKENQIFKEIVIDELKTQKETLEEIIGVPIDLDKIEAWNDYLKLLQADKITNSSCSIIAYCTIFLSTNSFHNTSVKETKQPQKKKV